MRISDWSSDVCSSDLRGRFACEAFGVRREKILERLLLLHRIRNEQGPLIEIGVADRNPRPVDAQRQSGNKARGQKRTERPAFRLLGIDIRSEEHTSELQSLMRISYAVFCLKKKRTKKTQIDNRR